MLRDKMATLKWELMEQCHVTKRTVLLGENSPEEYWKSYVDYLLAEINGHYDGDVEDSSVFKDKEVINYETAFEFMKTLPVKKETAFLFRK